MLDNNTPIDMIQSDYSAFTKVPCTLPISYIPYTPTPYPFLIHFQTPCEPLSKPINRSRRPSKYNKSPKVEYPEKSINEAIKEYQKLEQTKVLCSYCGNNVELIKSFGREGKYVCLNCSKSVYHQVGDLPDWEEEVEDIASDTACPCQRIKHTKDLSSFVRYNNKNGLYEIGQLCIFCRNVKRYEYLRKQNHKRARDENKMYTSYNISFEPPLKLSRVITDPINLKVKEENII